MIEWIPVALLLRFILSIFIYLDAESRGVSKKWCVYWVIATLFLLILPLIYWLCVRPPKKVKND